MLSPTPNGPYDNPAIDEGVYDATILLLVEGTYGKERFSYLKVVLELPDLDINLVTNFYFPEGAALRAEQRLWHFCCAVGLDKRDAVIQPELFRDRRLRIVVRRMQSEKINRGRPYYDVERFLPAVVELPESADEEETPAASCW